MKKTMVATGIWLLAGAASAQAPTPDPGVRPTPEPTVPISLTGLKPGVVYTAWSVGSDSVAEVSAGSGGVRVSPQAKELYLLDKKSGQVATLSLAGRKNGKLDAAKLTFAPLAPVRVSVTVLSSSTKKPVPDATVSLKDAAGNQQKGGVDSRGGATFENVKAGVATLHLAAGKAEASFQRLLLPRPPGTTITLTESLAAAEAPVADASPGVTVVPARGDNPPVVVLNQGEKPEPTNSVLPGWIGLILLGVGGFFGWRWLKNRGVTVKDALERAGVNLPDESPSGVNPNLRPPSPASAPLPPLPSLSDLPSAGPASASGVVMSTPTAAPPLPPPTGQPRLVGVRGTLAGQIFPLTDVLTIGREPDNGLALVGDSTASRKHAVVMPSPSGGWEVADSGSSNGTFVNGQRIAAPTPLAHGDELAIGAARLRFEA